MPFIEAWWAALIFNFILRCETQQFYYGPRVWDPCCRLNVPLLWSFFFIYFLWTWLIYLFLHILFIKVPISSVYSILTLWDAKCLLERGEDSEGCRTDGWTQCLIVKSSLKASGTLGGKWLTAKGISVWPSGSIWLMSFWWFYSLFEGFSWWATSKTAEDFSTARASDTFDDLRLLQQLPCS